MVNNSITLDTRVGASNNFSVSHINGSTIQGTAKFSNVDKDNSLFPDRMRMTVRILDADETTIVDYSIYPSDGVPCFFRKTEDSLYITLEWEYLLMKLCRVDKRFSSQHIKIW
jgi:hypothetical protein